MLTELIQDQIDEIANNYNISSSAAKKKLLSEKQPSLNFVKKVQIAKLIYFLCSKDACEITGSSLSIDGGWTAQ